MPSHHRKKAKAKPPPHAPNIPRVSLTSLPIEILAEVLLYTSSPPTVLAVSRTCSFLYRALALNSSADFIWRTVRKTCKPCPLPDIRVQLKMTEAEYAALVFGGGICEVCQKATREMYVSFAVRIRLCSRWHCRRKFLKEYLVDIGTLDPMPNAKSLWVPFLESNSCFRSAVTPETWPRINNVVLRKTDLEKFQLDLTAYEAAERARGLRSFTDQPRPLSEEDESRERLMERCNAAMQRFSVIMELSVELLNWKRHYDMKYDTVQWENKSFPRLIAFFEGWNYEDLIASQTYASLRRRRNSHLEYIERADVVSIRSAIESELLAMQAHHQRQKSEAAYKYKLSELKKIYDRMRSGNVELSSPSILPPLRVFYTLPSVRVLKGSPDPNVVPPNSVSKSNAITSSPLAMSLIESDIHAWHVPVQAYLMCLLGFPNGWQIVSTRTLPPLKRVTARFFCRRCGEGKVGRAYQRVQCLDLRGVCGHVCVVTQSKSTVSRQQEDEGDTDGKSKRKNRRVATLDWVVDVFEKDDKAIRFIKNLLKLIGRSEEDPSTASALNEKGGFIRCKTCPGWVVMDFDTAIGHAHRHESMNIELVPWLMCTTSSTDRPPALLAFERGTCDLLLRRSYRARKLCKELNYGCKHCVSVQLMDGIERPVEGKTRMMTFDGLRSHVKEKHGIADIRDEDVFCSTCIDKETSSLRG